eukprot:136794-Rhodomonas_salina.2
MHRNIHFVLTSATRSSGAGVYVPPKVGAGRFARKGAPAEAHVRCAWRSASGQVRRLADKD